MGGLDASLVVLSPTKRNDGKPSPAGPRVALTLDALCAKTLNPLCAQNT
jgi:hypothetical protein